MVGQRRRAAMVTAGAVVIVLLVALLGWWLTDGEDPEQPVVVSPNPVATRTDGPSPTPSPTPRPSQRPRCAPQPGGGFVPTRVGVEGVVRGAEVMGVPRDEAGIPGVPPVERKDVFAWDLGGVEPGSRRGHVLLNAHTWPDGSALGNHLLDGLQVGDRIELSRRGRLACYRVTERVEVAVEDGYPGWTTEEGPPQVVIVVCSGVRRGPGDWSHRTLWFADLVDPSGRAAVDSNPTPMS